MKIYKTREEAEENREDGKRLSIASFNGSDYFAWCQPSSTSGVASAVFVEIGGHTRWAESSGKGNPLMRIRSLPKADAIAILDKLRAEIEGNGKVGA